jgi:hypothetical protein
MKYRFFIFFITFLAFVSAVQAGKSSKSEKKSTADGDRSVVGSVSPAVVVAGGQSGVINGPLSAENQETLTQLQEKAQGLGAGGGAGIALIEPSNCQSFDSPVVAQAASRTIGGCAPNTCDGCCRYHSAFLTCDTTNTFKQLDCVCNGRTNNANSVIKAVTTGGSTGNGVVAVVSGGQTGGGTTVTSPVSPASPGTTTGSSTSCMNGSEYQKLGTQFTNCSAGIDCAGVTLSDGITPTCCKR